MDNYEVVCEYYKDGKWLLIKEKMIDGDLKEGKMIFWTFKYNNYKSLRKIMEEQEQLICVNPSEDSEIALQLDGATVFELQEVEINDFEYANKLEFSAVVAVINSFYKVKQMVKLIYNPEDIRFLYKIRPIDKH